MQKCDTLHVYRVVFVGFSRVAFGNRDVFNSSTGSLIAHYIKELQYLVLLDRLIKIPMKTIIMINTLELLQLKKKIKKLLKRHIKKLTQKNMEFSELLALMCHKKL